MTPPGSFFMYQPGADPVRPGFYLQGFAMPDQKPQDSDEDEYSLSDLSVESVGLVTRGAVTLGDEVGKNFFLLKSQEATMDNEELVIEEVTDDSVPAETPDDISPTEDAGFMKWFQGLFKARTQKQSDSLKLAAKALRDGGFSIDARKLAGMMSGMDGEEPDDMEMSKAACPSCGEDVPAGAEYCPHCGAELGKKVGKAMNEQTVALLVKAQVEAMQAAWTAEREALVKSAKQEVETQYQAEITDLKSRVEKAEQDKAVEVEAREKGQFIEKAMAFRALPVSHVEAGDLLYKAHKSLDPETYEKLESLIKATDSMIGGSQLFAEFGRAGSTLEVSLDDEVKAIAKAQNIPYEEALVKLPVHKQLQLLGEMRGGN